MTPVESRIVQSIQYSPYALSRADRVVRCAPFCLPLFLAMREQGVSLKAIAGSDGVRHNYTRQPLLELAAENQLLWLIQVGVLRREVDGQGLTDSFRLTPMGRQLLRRWHSDGRLKPASWLDRLSNAINRWVRLPNWLQ